MDASQILSSLGCEIRIIRAKNTDFKSGELFVRCYLSAGNNTRVKLNSREISTKSDLFWNESFSLDCFGTRDSIDKLKQGTVVFEFRWRTPIKILGAISGSRLLGRAEIPCRCVFEAPDMAIEKWITMTLKRDSIVFGDVKPPTVQIGMKFRVPARAQTKKIRRRLTELDECVCRDHKCACVDYEIFAIAAALEAL